MDIKALPPITYRPLANWFRSMADSLEDQADVHDQGDDRRHVLKRRRQTVHSAGEMLATYLVNGQTADQALETVAKITGLEIDALRLVLPRAKKTAAGGRRDRQIMQLVAKGWKDCEIGQKFSLHPKSVNRIIARIRAA